MIKGKNIFLRALEPSDIDPLFKWENDTGVWKVSNTLAPWSRHVLEAYILSSHQDIYTAKQLRLMICTNMDQKPVGCIDLFDFDPNHMRAGIGVMIDQEKRGNGIASEALDLMIEHCFSMLNLHQVYCNVAVDNEPSLKLFSKKGFHITGTKKEWIRNGAAFCDEHTLQLIRK